MQVLNLLTTLLAMSLITTRNLLKFNSLVAGCYALKFLVFPDWFLDNSLLVRDNAVRILRLWGLGVQPGLAAMHWIAAHSSDEDTIHSLGILHTVWCALGATAFYLFMPAGAPMTLANVGLYGLMSAIFGYTSFLAPRTIKKI